MFVKAQTTSGMRVFLGALVLVFLFTPRAEAAVCEGGVLKDKAGGAPIGTCTLASGDGADVTCTGGQLTSGGTNVGTCSLAQPPQDGLQRDGVFGCSSSKYSNVGSLSAIGGVYVPVNDAAVTLNTGYLVYKECVLDGVISKITEAARTDLVSTVSRRLNQGRNGRPLWIREPYQEYILNQNDRAMKIGVSEQYTQSMCSPYKDTIVRAHLIKYLQDKNTPNSAFACSFPSSLGDQKAILDGTGVTEKNVLAGLRAIVENNPIVDSLVYRESLNEMQATAQYLFEKQVVDGFYPVTDGNDNPFIEKTETPAYLVSQGAQQVYTAGFRCLEGADELSEVCAPMFSAMVPESFNNGFYSMTQAQSGLASYVSRMVNEASAAVRAEAVNAALNILLTTRQFEFAFKQAKEASATILTSAINRLRAVERTCWELIINNPSGPKVCASPPDAEKKCTTPEQCTTNPDGTQTCTPGIQLRVATSTQFSQAIIDAQMAPIVKDVAAELDASSATLQELDRLITDVTNASSAANQRAALSRLDQMVAPNSRLPDCSPQKTLHSAGDVQCANKQRDDLNSAIGLLVENTVRDWGDSQDPNVGWCNVNNPSTIERWINAWKI